jgi:hypothetical protein
MTIDPLDRRRWRGVALATPAAAAVAMTAVAARTVRVVRPLAHMLIVVDMGALLGTSHVGSMFMRHSGPG